MSNIRKKTLKNRIWLVVLLLPVLFMLFMLFAPASATVHFRRNTWSCQYATFLFDREDPKLFIELIIPGGYRTPELGAIHSISLRDKAITGSLFAYNDITIKGITDNYIWTQKRGGEVIGRSLSDLTEKLNANTLLDQYPEITDILDIIKVDGLNDQLRIYTLDGHQYAWNPGQSPPVILSNTPPELKQSHKTVGRKTFGGTFHIPSNIGNTFLIEAKPLFDIQQQKMIAFENGDYLVAFNSLKGPNGKLQIARINQNGGFVWKQAEKNLILSTSEKSRQLSLSALNNNTLYLILQDYQGSNDVYLVAIDIESGKKIWELVLG